MLFRSDVLTPLSNIISRYNANAIAADFPSMTIVDPNLKNGYVHSYFAGIQKRFGNNLSIETDALGAYSRRLITTDIVNRDFTLASGRLNDNLPDISYRSGQGYANYNALASIIRYRSGNVLLQGSYTWSHVIDNQSDALTGDFFNLSFTSIGGGGASGKAAFSKQFDPNVDRANADFDQRHNFVLVAYWTAPRYFEGRKLGTLVRDWTFGGLTAIRSGFPYSLLGTSNVTTGGGLIYNNRPDLINPAAVYTNQPAAGGVKLLNAAAFQNAAASTLGNIGRNSFRGPGFYNLDLSVAREFRLPKLGERMRLRIRADAFNFLNHTNLGNPDTLLTSPTFGVASFGRQGQSSGFPAISPLNETPRQIQFSARIEF